MKQRVMDFIKNNPFVFYLYNRLGSLLIKFFGLFIPIKQKKILFVSFGGKKYDDSPQSIYEKMASMPEFNDYQFIWAFIDIKKEIPYSAKKVKIDSFAYFYHALSSKFWIINVSAERGLRFKKRETICINTWHGTPIKRIYGEERLAQKSKNKRQPEDFNLVCAQSSYDQKIFSRIFHMSEKDIILSDLPRNDILLKYNQRDKGDIKIRLKIPEGKKVILYMPTYREYLRDENNACYLAPPMDVCKWKEKLENQYILLIRAHYLVAKDMNIAEDDDFVKDVSSYPQLSELYAIADLMISDYSSAFFDYSVLERPMFCFAYDLDEYEEKRGFYLQLSNELPCTVHENEDDLLKDIITMNVEESVKRVQLFKQKYAPYAGHATDYVIREIMNRYL